MIRETSMACWDPEDEFETPTIESMKDVETYTMDDLKWLAKQGKGYCCFKAVVISLKRFFKKSINIHCKAIKFDGLNEMINFMKDNKGLIIHSCTTISIDDIHMNILRYYVTPTEEPVCINWFTYILNKKFI